MLKFYWNGIKDNGGKLQTCHYSLGNVLNYPVGTITIYKREYSTFSAGIREAFTVKNDSDYQSDYTIKEHIRVEPDHPLYALVITAYHNQQEHQAKQTRKQAERCIAAHA